MKRKQVLVGALLHLLAMAKAMPKNNADSAVIIDAGPEGELSDIPTDNAFGQQAGFRLPLPNSANNDDAVIIEAGNEGELSPIPTDNTFGQQAGFRLPLPYTKRSSAVEADCSLNLDAGDGSLAQPQLAFYYDGAQCKEFQFTGGQGNSNRFASESACRSVCDNNNACVTSAPQCSGQCVASRIDDKCYSPDCCCLEKPVSSEVCQLPKKSGLCYGRIAKWHFNAESGKCEMFEFGGCEAGANDNRFDCKEMCERVCNV